MKTATLAPIEHRDAYNVPAQRELTAWLREAIFAPLFAVLSSNDVPVDPRWQAIRFDEFGRDNATDWVEFPPEWGSLGLDRDEMPQIPAESRGALVSFLAARGVSSGTHYLRPDELKPTQSGYHADKVARAREHAGEDRAILASVDGYILDGHHQWTAARLDRPDVAMRVTVFTAPINILLRLARQLPSSFRSNTSSALIDALDAGRVHYAEGVFYGKFSSSITKELRDLGAKFDAKTKTFRIVETALPADLRGVLATSAQKGREVTTQLLDVLKQAEENLALANVGLKLEQAVGAIIDNMGTQLADSMLTLTPESIGIVPKIDPGVRNVIAEEYTNNLDLSIKGFAKERIPELRKRVEENALVHGGRTDRLAKIIEAEFGVSKRKAEFLADQETGLLCAKYREAKYRELGIAEYFWSTSRDRRARETHRALQGKRCSFAVGANVAPPGKPARYCNPGQDYRCRCVPRPIVNLAEIAA